MKKIIILTITLMSALAQARSLAPVSCDAAVTKAYQSLVEEKDYEFDGVSRISTEYVQEVLAESVEIDETEKPTVLEWAKEKNTIMYEGVSNYMSGTGLDFIFVDSETCEIKMTVMWYAE